MEKLSKDKRRISGSIKIRFFSCLKLFLRYDKNMKNKNKKVFVAMSGGVDSSVAAGLLKQKGYQVTGVFLRLFQGQSEKPAKSVAKKLGLPFLVLDFRKEFKKEVIDYFLKEYAVGRTPNPCVVCNQKIKFGLFLRETLKRGADLIATGHYVKQIGDCPRRSRGQSPIQGQSLVRLFQAKDKEKDQSYFLWTLTQKQLARILFPLGDATKKQVYQLAKEWGLPHRSEESFDICFLAGKDHNQFLKKYLKLKPGAIVDTQGRKISQHQGLSLYTIGQRREVGIGGTGPYYVVEMDYKSNALIVTDSPFDERLYKKGLIAAQVNWISGQRPKLPLSIKARIRYRHQAVPAVVLSLRATAGSVAIPWKSTGLLRRFAPRNDKIKSYQLIFKTFQRAITPGQSVVFYQRHELLGGGIIDKNLTT